MNNVDKRVQTSAATRVLLRRAVRYVLYSLVALIAVYLVVATFAVRFISAGSGHVLVRDPIFEGGQAPAGSVILVSENEPKMKPGLMRNFVDSVTHHPDAKVVTVEAGPFGKVEKNKEGLTTVDGRVLSGSLDNPPSYLGDQYIVSDGDKLLLVNETQVLGEVLGRH